MGRFEDDFRDSHEAFIKNWPEISKGLGLEGVLIAIQGSDDPTNNALDMEAGFDFWLKRKEGGVCGLSARCQFGQDYHSATWRVSRTNGHKTEEEKRVEAATNPDKRSSNPIYHVQVYFNNREEMRPLYAVRMLIDDMVEACKQEYERILWIIQTNHQDGTKFKVFWSKAMSEFENGRFDVKECFFNGEIEVEEPVEEPLPF